MFKPALSAQEIQLLKNHFRKSPIALIRVKAQAVLMNHRGLPQEEIAELVVKNIRSVQRYLAGFSRKRLASLFSGHTDNENASKLTRKQKQEIKTVLSRPPEAGGLPKKFWDVPVLKHYVNAQFGVVYKSRQSYHFLLKFSGLSFKYPDKLSPRRNEALISQRIKAVRKEIKPYLASPEWVVLAADETRLQLEAEIRRAWLAKGQRTIVKTERSKIHQSYLGFLNQKTGRCRAYGIKKGKQIYIIPVLERLVAKYPGKNVCVVWDNATCHKGKLLRVKLKKGNTLEKLHLVAFPPYAPDHNPVEHVWQYAKRKIANRDSGDFKLIKKAFLRSIRSRTFAYRI